jgi:hypothetical protein
MSDDAQSFVMINTAVEWAKSHPEAEHVRIVLPVAPSVLPSNATSKKPYSTSVITNRS